MLWNGRTGVQIQFFLTTKTNIVSAIFNDLNWGKKTFKNICNVWDNSQNLITLKYKEFSSISEEVNILIEYLFLEEFVTMCHTCGKSLISSIIQRMQMKTMA